MVHEIPAEWLPVRCETNRPSGPIGLSAVSVLVVAQSSSEIAEGLMNNPVYIFQRLTVLVHSEMHVGLKVKCLFKTVPSE